MTDTLIGWLPNYSPVILWFIHKPVVFAGVCLVFGGIGSWILDDTFEWDGQKWECDVRYGTGWRFYRLSK